MKIPQFRLSNHCYSALLLLGWLLAGKSSLTAMGPEIARDPETKVSSHPSDSRSPPLIAAIATLEGAPREGLAFDRVYGFHVLNGTVDQFVREYQDRTIGNPKAANAWAIVGLIELQRGRNAAAVGAFSTAQAAAPQDAWFAYYHGRALIRMGQFDQATQNLELAVQLNPKHSELPEFYLALARIHFLNGRIQDAIAVCSRLEDLAPSETSILRQTIALLVEYGQDQSAADRYEKLIRLTLDEYRGTVYRLQFAELKFRQNSPAEAIAVLEQLLQTLKPESELATEVYRCLENHFLRESHLPTLLAYYRARLDKNPQDLDCLIRLVRALIHQGKLDEAQARLIRALKDAPQRADLRRMLIEVLIENQKIMEALEQYELLDQAAPNKPEVLRDWGQSLLRSDNQLSKVEGRKAVEKLWRRLLVKPRDPAEVIQVAEWFRRAEMFEAALDAYQIAATLAPDDPQYLVALGEFQMEQQNPKAALATWRNIAVGQQRTAANLTRLADILAAHGFLEEASTKIQSAARLAPKDFAVQIKSADLLVKDKKYTSALIALLRAEKLAQNPIESELVLSRQLAVYQQDDSLGWRGEQLLKDVQSTSATAKHWLLLSRFQEIQNLHTKAAQSLAAARKLEPTSIPVLQASVRVAEKSGNLALGVELLRQLADADSSNRTSYLSQIIVLETLLGEHDEVLKVGRELTAAPSVNADDHEFFGKQCQELGLVAEGLQALTRALTLQPDEPRRALLVAQTLIELNRPDAAAEYFWKALESTVNLDDKVRLVQTLAAHSRRVGNVESFLSRIGRQQQDADNGQIPSILLAEAYHALGQFAMSRQTLESLLAGNAADVLALNSLARLAGSDGDLLGAIHYARRAARLSPGPDTEYALANFLAQAGEVQDCAEILVRVLHAETDGERFLQGLDRLQQLGQHESVLLLINTKLHQHPGQWELRYRRGVAMVNQNPEAAVRDFQAVLEYSNSQTPAQASRDQFRLHAKTGEISNRLLDDVDQVRMMTGLATLNGNRPMTNHGWTPTGLAPARLATLGWLFRLARDARQNAAFLELYQTAAASEKATSADLWNWICLITLTGGESDQAGDPLMITTLLKRLVTSGDPQGQYLYLQLLRTSQLQATWPDQNGASATAADGLALSRTAYFGLQHWGQLNGDPDVASRFSALVATDPKRGTRREESRRVFELIATLDSLTLANAEVSRVLEALDKFSTTDEQAPHQKSTVQQRVASVIRRSITAKAGAKKEQECLELLDYWLDQHAPRADAIASRNSTNGDPSRESSSRTFLTQVQPGDGSKLSSHYFSPASISILRASFDAFRTRSSIGDLTEHLTRRLEKAKVDAILPARLALAYVALWNGESDSALKHMLAASEIAGNGSMMELEIARFQIDAGQYSEALSRVESFKPTNQFELQEREVLAFEIAIRSANNSRAIEAANRMCAYDLGIENQIQIAAKLRNRGLANQADAILARARWRVDSHLPSLANLITAFQSQSLKEPAKELAFQILRQSILPQSSDHFEVFSGSGGRNDSPRFVALRALSATGQLAKLITATEVALNRVPGDPRPFDPNVVQNLFEYYAAGNRQQKLIDLEDRLLAANPQDIDLRLRHAHRLAQNGNAPKACEAYLVVLGTQPGLIKNDYYRVFDAFRQANKEVELVAAFGEVNLTQFENRQAILYLVSTLRRRQPPPANFLTLVQKIWDEWPDHRVDLLVDAIGFGSSTNALDLSPYARLVLVPTAKAVSVDPWVGLSRIGGLPTQGKANGVLKWVLDLSTQTNELPQLRGELAKHVNAQPTWKAGPLILAAIDLRMGQIDLAKPVLERAVATSLTDFPFEARWQIALELESQPELRPLAIQIYESLTQANSSNGSYEEFNYSPRSRLLTLYSEMGRLDDAKRLLIAAEQQRFTVSYNPAYDAQRMARQWLTVALEYENLGLETDAARLYRRIIRSTSAVESMNTRSIDNSNYEHRQASDRWQSLLRKWSRSTNRDLSAFLFHPTELPDELANETAREPILDLMLELQVDPDGTPKLECELVKYLALKRVTPQMVEEQLVRFRELARHRPGDISIPIAAAILAQSGGNASQIDEAVKDLKSFLQRNTSPAKPSQKPFSPRISTAVPPELGLGMVANQCLKTEKWRSDGEFLLTQALVSAKHLSNIDYTIALLHGRVQLAIQSGDKKSVESQLAEILNIVVAQRGSTASGSVDRPENTSVSREEFGSPGTAARAGNGLAAQKTAPATFAQTPHRPFQITRFRQILMVADIAVEQGLQALAARAIRESMAGGWPVADSAGSGGQAESVSMRSFEPGRASATEVETMFPSGVETRLLRVVQVWKTKGYPTEELYNVLHDLVLPTSNPGRIILFKNQINLWRDPQSLGRELVLLAARRKLGETLRAEIQKRQINPDSVLKGRVLRTQLAVAMMDDPSAITLLQELAEHISEQPSQDVAFTAAHAVAVALDRSELHERAIPVLEECVKILMPMQSNQADQAVEVLARCYLKSRHFKELGTLYADLTQARKNRYNNPNADWGQSRKRVDLAAVAAVIGSAGDLPTTLGYLAKAVDLPVNQTYGDSVNALATPLWYLTRQVRAANPDEAYVLLRDWTFPSAGRNSLRYAVANLPGRQVPDSFRSGEEAVLGTPPDLELVSNFSLLVELAKQAGQLTDLQIATEAAVDGNLLHAEGLSTLVALALGDGANPQRVATLIQTIKARAKSPNQAELGLAAYADSRTLELQILEAAIESDLPHELVRALGQAILDENRSARQFGRIAHAAWGLARVERQGLSPDDRARLLWPNLRLWHPDLPPTMTPNHGAPAWWVAHEGHVSHISGPATDELYFRYPLTGTFEFSFDVHSYHFAEGEIGYGGLISAPQFWANDVQIWSIGQHDVITRAATASAGDNWNRYSVRVSPEAIRFYSNGHLTFEESAPSRTSPWLHLTCVDHRRTVFRNLQFIGTPTIPRQVELVHEDRLEGWGAAPGETQRKWLIPREQARKQGIAPDTVNFYDSRQYDWQAEGGVLRGRRNIAAGDEAQGSIHYARPLQEGETFQYEFFYEPGKSHVHPTLGNLAFLLEPTGVRLHWLARDQADSQLLLPNNVADEPQLTSQSTPRPGTALPLKVADWNRLKITLAGGVCRCSLNDALVFQRPLEASNTRKFGLFHYRGQTEALVRQLILSSQNWPEKLSAEELANPLIPENANESQALKWARHAIVREEELSANAYQVVIRSRGMSPESRFDFLRDWVLPGASHPTLRMQATYSQTDPVVPLVTGPGVNLNVTTNQNRPESTIQLGSRQHLGGEIIAPVLDLVRLAARLKRIEELELAVSNLATPDVTTPRHIIAFQTLLQIAKGDDAAAARSLKALIEILPTVDPTTPFDQRSPELLAVEAALERPELRKDAHAIAQLLPHTYKLYGEGEKRLLALRAKSTWLTLLASNETPDDLQSPRQWMPVSHPTAETRGKGFAPPKWHFEKGKARFLTGYGGDALYFQSPLTGNFELRMQRTTFGWREIHALYGGIGIELNYDGKSVLRFVMSRWGQKQFPVEIPNWGPDASYRLVIQDGRYTAFANGKQVHTEPLSKFADPWLQIRSIHSHYDGTVSNVQILGSPTIPDQLSLSDGPDLSVWRSDYYAETIDTPNAHWNKVNDEITGSLYDNAPNSHRESVLYYHRPLLEDGELDYEFYYEPGKTEVHPVLDRASFLLAPTGIRLHNLTDNTFEKSGLNPENVVPLMNSAKTIPLKPQAWNKFRLKLIGDQITFTLNDQLIGTHILAATNQRNFGLFHYADATNARVRNVTYRGDWPKVLPAIQDQQLSE